MALTKVGSIVDAFFTFSAIIGGGMVGMFFLGLLTKRCSKVGLYAGLAVGVPFIIWAALTKNQTICEVLPGWIPTYRIHIYWLGLLGNIVVFAAG
jgi:SSS family solute:Na+ symporter